MLALILFFSFTVQLKAFLWGDDNIQKIDNSPKPVEEVVTETKQISDNIKDIYLTYVIENVEKSNEFITEFKEKVASKKFFVFNRTEQEKAEIMIEQMKKVRDFYVKLASRDDLEETFYGFLIKIDELSNDLKETVKEEILLLNEKERTLNSLEEYGYSDEQLTIRAKALYSQTVFIKERINMINHFLEDYKHLKHTVSDIKSGISKFVFTVKNSAEVYKEAYKTLKLAKDISLAYNTISELNSMNSLSEEITQSWKELESTIKNLSKQMDSFN
jgi:hypothetical protein